MYNNCVTVVFMTFNLLFLSIQAHNIFLMFCSFNRFLEERHSRVVKHSRIQQFAHCHEQCTCKHLHCVQIHLIVVDIIGEFPF